jgi:hypothetical protein
MTDSDRRRMFVRFALALLLAACALPARPTLAQDAPDQAVTPDDAIPAAEAQKPSTDGEGKPVRMLFLGNSYTACAGGQPNLVPGLMRLQGQEVSVAVHIRAGETLEGFWLKNAGEELTARQQKVFDRQADDARRELFMTKIRKERKATIGSLDALLAKGPYDVVVIQAWLGARTPGGPAFHKYADLLVEKIRKACPDARIVLYMTWGSQNKPAEQKVIAENCYQAALKNDMIVAPAGEATWALLAERKDLKMFRTEKDSHPGHDGAYVIACTLYAAVTGKSPVGLPTEVMAPVSYDFPIGVKDPERAAKQKALGHPKEVKWSIDPEKAAAIQKHAWAACGRAAEQLKSKLIEQETRP